MARKKAVKAEKKEYRIVQYFREVRVEVGKVVWPTRRATLNLTGVVLATIVAMSLALGLVDWIFTQLLSLILG